MSQLLTQIQDLQNKVSSLTDARDFYDPETATLEHPTFPANPGIFRAPEVCLAASLDCRLTHGIPWVLHETFLKAYLLEKDHLHLSSSGIIFLRIGIQVMREI